MGAMRASEAIVLGFAVLLFLVTIPFSLFFCYKTVRHYERAVIFRLGRLRYQEVKGPGMLFILVCIDSMRVIDLRTVTLDVPPQDVLTKDSVSVKVDAVVYYRIMDPISSCINVKNCSYSTKLLAMTTLRNILGMKSLSELLTDREAITSTMREILDIATDPWGVKIERVEIASKSASTSVSNIWIRRNSSEAVSQLLAPDLSPESSTYTTVDASEDRRTIYSTKNIKTRPNKSHSHPSYCYCSEKPIRPKLNLKPRDLEEERPKFRHNLEGQWTEFQTHGVKRIPKSYDQQIYERERLNAQNNTEVDLNYTDKRKEYEESKSSGQNEEFEEHYGVYNKNEEEKRKEYEKSKSSGRNEEFEEHDGVYKKNEEERTGNSVPKTDKEATEVEVGSSSTTNKQTLEEGAGRSSTNKKCYERSCKCTFSDIDKESGIKEKTTSDKIRDLTKFRKSNFFETHSVKTNSASCAPDHKCVHKFRLNDRFLPEPVHSDDFGISRCTICNKPMEQATSRQTTPSTYSSRRKKSKHNNVKKIYEYNLIPPRLNIGTGKEVVEISVPQKMERDCFGGSHNFNVAKRLAPVQSFALRFQKGVI